MGKENEEASEWLESKIYHVYMHLSPAIRKARENRDAESVSWFKLLFNISKTVKGCKNSILPAIDVTHILFCNNCGKDVL